MNKERIIHWILIAVAIGGGLYVLITFVRLGTTGLLVTSGTVESFEELPEVGSYLVALKGHDTVRYTVREFHRIIQVRFTAVLSTTGFEDALGQHLEWREASFGRGSFPSEYAVLFDEFGYDGSDLDEADIRRVVCMTEYGKTLELLYDSSSGRLWGISRIDHSVKSMR